jgi:broad specificity phosphatase PhoE
LSHLILVRHSNPEILTDRPASQWRLSAAGRERAQALSTKLDPYQPSVVYSSQEPKAIETASILAGNLRLPHEQVDGLHEHRRNKVGWTTKEQFRSRVSEFFAEPNELVFGDETAAQAANRFAGSINEIVRVAPQDTTAVVSHGTVITLFVCESNDIDPYHFWLTLEMPSFVVLDLPTYDLKAIVSLESK